MLSVTLRSLGGVESALDVSRRASLADVQRDICRLFRQRFPATKASLVIDEATYDEFKDKPFLTCADGVSCTVLFEDTDEPFFIDMADRLGIKIHIDELVAYDYASEVAARDGSSIEELEVWVKHRRFGKPK
jgi:uncharacterized protein (DUF1697 family)